MRDICLLDGLLEPNGLSVVFQPIFEIHSEGWRLHAVECLTRGPKGTNLEMANVLFEYVRRKREENRVDRACVSTAIRGARRIPGTPRISLNVHASTLVKERDFPDLLQRETEQSGISISNLTVEIVEHVPFWDGARFLGALEALRRIGVAIALDDIGLGQSNYRMILDTKPDYFKIDQHLVRGCQNDYYRCAIVESIVHLAIRFGARVVAEGVEDVTDLDTVTNLGVDMVQGHIFCPALPAEQLIETGLLEGQMVTTRLACA